MSRTQNVGLTTEGMDCKSAPAGNDKIDMKKSYTIRNIILIPQRFYGGNISIYSLLKESGYFELHNQISEADIFEELIQHSEYIDQWLRLSEDKRASSGWYFSQNDNGKYIVSYYPPKENLEMTEYFDKVEVSVAQLHLHKPYPIINFFNLNTLLPEPTNKFKK